VHVHDTAEAFWCALEAPRVPHHVYNLRAEQRPVGAITAAIRRLVPEAQITVSRESIGELQLMNNDLLVEELGFAPRYTIETGVQQYVNEVRERQG
jgi:nucleoside-diphosphate-sugar epimerase